MTQRKKSTMSKKLVLVAGALVLLLVAPAYARLYTINGDSMAPTTQNGDQLLVNLAAYDLKLPYTGTTLVQVGNPERGDLVVYHDPRGYSGMKRIIGLPGDEIEMRENEVFLNGKSIRQAIWNKTKLQGQLDKLYLENLEVPLGDSFAEERLGDTAYIVSFTPGRSERESHGPVTVPEGSYFLLGDHRDFSGDSRFDFQGFMRRGQIIGKVVAGENPLPGR